eukprot:CAMPEP_0198353926 /NCGR_PEP_ID=MMETSP1450-20131203/113347_1 /TAXON_ID=753684 ORGANISM="Madagascaria erythrocladiodes, Strain CCMP3234" /NCGR_SAMPLE_ID=MMETSP1450 /ASSEMBLY_ACC=CAM_ASM_001115 /LENGTH=57 /DNA_ID=CAMNT_0044060133 /DNA_START=30 /DNA_END=199 /DNA_ORIENTATION=+
MNARNSMKNHWNPLTLRESVDSRLLMVSVSLETKCTALVSITRSTSSSTPSVLAALA